MSFSGNAGFAFDKVQIGGTGGGPGKKNVAGPIALNEEDAKQLEELTKKGVEIYCQVTPEMNVTTWASIKSKHFPNV
ncbi:PTS sugar transporter subunit IIB [Eubacteriales bacterium OttesenSCG-928-N14]|nr:PTS sugar transporter subunit IIB [Eubacteriales bacterium OttesenSCG-928-N14]